VADVDALTVVLSAAGRGDHQALVSFIRDTQADVWRFAAHLVDPQSADDLTQETYLRAVRAAPSFAGRSSARTWLLAIAHRVCMDELRARTRRRRRDALLPWVNPAPVEPDVAGEVTAAALLADLDLDRRTAFVLTQLIGLSYEEAAQACGCPVGTIRSRVARARADLVQALDADRVVTLRPVRSRRSTPDLPVAPRNTLRAEG
jgi:RNA polymerase sigma-70 factor (ECF subfamily)